jgi:hypothetical protein
MRHIDARVVLGYVCIWCGYNISIKTYKDDMYPSPHPTDYVFCNLDDQKIRKSKMSALRLKNALQVMLQSYYVYLKLVKYFFLKGLSFLSSCVHIM